MAIVSGRSTTCGRPITLEAPDGFDGADLVAATCPQCADDLIAEAGGAVLDMGRPPGALFALGKVHVTGGELQTRVVPILAGA